VKFNWRMPPRVAVFGAGVTGLTAAHELIERGFQVRVYEETPPGPDEEVCGIGGMARTQYATVPVQNEEYAQHPQETKDAFIEASPLSEARAAFLALRIPFREGLFEPDPDALTRLEQVFPFIDSLSTNVQLVVRGYTCDPQLKISVSNEAGVQERLDYKRAARIVEILGTRIDSTRLEAVAFGYGLPNDPRAAAADREYVDFQLLEDLLPGEHGFRFFPSFYRHLFDTMSRIPLSAHGTVFRESGRTVADNLVTPETQGIAYEDHDPASKTEALRATHTMPRRLPKSARELLKVIRESLERSGVTIADALKLQEKFLRYMTSCPGRRTEYEKQSWWDFIDGDSYTPRCRQYLETSPQMLVAMRASQSDARTIGNVAVQLFLDQFTNGERTDRTLNAPTTTAWLAPWQRYLVRQGVEFVRGRLRQLRKVGRRTVAVVELAEEVHDDAGLVATSWRETALDFDYYVVAVSANEAQKIVRDEFRKKVAGDPFKRCDCARIAKLELGDATLEQPGGHVDHMSGIQFYFRSEVAFVAGHTVYPDSKWGLSSIAQPQFWSTRRGWWDGYRGLLSVDIGNWHTKGSKGKTAWSCTPDEIAEEVWAQIMATSIDPDVEPPLFYHLDDNIVLDPETRRPVENKTPMLINAKGTFRNRPGHYAGDHFAYHLHNKQLVFAGTYLQTYTRLTCMEAANESARHAVSAILRDAKFQGDEPRFWNPESNEFPDLEWLVELDGKLHAQGLPHVFDVLGSSTALLKSASPSIAITPGKGA
jgi:hypothetical protein